MSRAHHALRLVYAVLSSCGGESQAQMGAGASQSAVLHLFTTRCGGDARGVGSEAMQEAVGVHLLKALWKQHQNSVNGTGFYAKFNSSDLDCMSSLCFGEVFTSITILDTGEFNAFLFTQILYRYFTNLNYICLVHNFFNVKTNCVQT